MGAQDLRRTAIYNLIEAGLSLGYVTAEDFRSAADLEPVRGSRLPRGRRLQPGEVRALFAACEDDDRKKPAVAARDAAIPALLFGSGLPRAEAVGLDVADYDRDAGTLRVRGEGNKERLAHLGDARQAALEAWLFVRGRLREHCSWPSIRGEAELRQGDVWAGDAVHRATSRPPAERGGLFAA